MSGNSTMKGFRGFNTENPVPGIVKQGSGASSQESQTAAGNYSVYFCPFCRHTLLELNRFCSQCGKYIADPAFFDDTVTANEYMHTQKLTPSSELQFFARRNFSWAWLAYALVGLSFLVIGFFIVGPLNGFVDFNRESNRDEVSPSISTEAVFVIPKQEITVTQVSVVVEPTSPPDSTAVTVVPTLLAGATYTAPTILSERVRTHDEMVQVYVPAGEFVMGSNDGEEDERPARTVFVDSFWIDQTEVTTAQYQRCVAEKGCFLPDQLSSATRSSYYLTDGYENYPVVFVNWHSANAYCTWVGGRLPSEEEWEKAARGTDGRTYPWGNSAPDSTKLNFDNQVGDTMPVGSYPTGKSPYGALNMSGNVWEWIGDPFSAQYMGHRGGAWDFGPSVARPANRGGDNPDSAYHNLGFRCVGPD